MLSLTRQCTRCGRQLAARLPVRSLFSQTGKWEKDFTKALRSDLEQYWKEKVSKVENKTKDSQKKYYVLSMFPYPSGQLHMGHVRVYTISDVMARYHRLAGRDVIHPMGWDAFGLPAENAAIERGERPPDWTRSNIKSMKKQLEELSCSFDWSTEFATCDPEYYRWTQYLFLKLYKAGLVHQREGAVNWDPVDQTVLADEQIDEFGRSWRSGAKAEKRFIRQWYIKATAYSKSLLDGLSELNSDLWKDILDLQRHWIGSCDGVRLEFKVKLGDDTLRDPLSIFTRHPQCIYGASHILLSSEHFFNNQKYFKNKTSDNSDITELSLVAINPFTGSAVPIYVSTTWDHVASLDSHLGIPDVFEEDQLFAEERSLSYTTVLDKATDSIRHSEEFTGLSTTEAFHQVADAAKKNGWGGDVTSDKARDWLISRQRYWGTPIPIVHCPKYGPVPVAFEDLPVTLPDVTTLTGKGQSPLLTQHDWLKVKCARCDCDGHGVRETDTMDTFVDSSWYFLRYLDADNDLEPVSREKAHAFMPVDLYIGGKEHATMHLYYARFFQHFLYDAGVVPQKEPFVNLLTQGMVMGQSYQVKETGKYLTKEQVDFSGREPVEADSGATLLLSWEKMSKSKHNGVDPQDVLNEFGCDSTRLSILSNVAPKSDRKWSHDVFHGVQRWQNRMWSIVSLLREHRGQHQSTPDETGIETHQNEIRKIRNDIVNQISHHMDNTFLLNTAISRLQELTNALKKVPGSVLAECPQCERAVADLTIMLSPFAPLFASELWEGIRQTANHVVEGYNWEESVWLQSWPVVDPDYKIPMNVKVDGRFVFEVRLAMSVVDAGSMTKHEALSLAEAYPSLRDHLKGRPVKGSTLNIEPGVRVELNLTTKRKQKKGTSKKS